MNAQTINPQSLNSQSLPVTTTRQTTSSDRLFLAGGPGFAQHRQVFGPLPSLSSAQLIDELRASGLAGRGGSGFPAWRKLAALDPAARGRSVIIANGAEGEPMSAKDATLLARAPHLVIDGLLLAAASLGSGDLYLYCSGTALGAARRALDEREDARRIQLREAPETFISGEASAVVRSIEKGVALPRDHRKRLTEAGLGGRPTLVHNVETLAQVALVARYGAHWFRSQGVDDESGTRLLTVRAPGNELRVIEVPGGITIDDALRRARVDPASLSAVLVGGYHGGWVPAQAFGTPLTRDRLAPFGASPGAGIVMGLAKGSCPIQVSAQIASYLAGQSARQCGPCVNGLPKMAETLSRLAGSHSAGGPLPATLAQEVRRLARIVTGRGSCHHPDGTAQLVLSTLSTFASDVDAHLAGHCEEARA
jgi:NADH:ubiquinone oxidoreductase subunit F (NADH-binding)